MGQRFGFEKAHDIKLEDIKDAWDTEDINEDKDKIRIDFKGKLSNDNEPHLSRNQSFRKNKKKFSDRNLVLAGGYTPTPLINADNPFGGFESH
jgi:hypothetical protein